MHIEKTEVITMKKQSRKLVLSALFAALCCMMTLVIQIPAPTGYVNLGDCAVLLGAWVLGPVWGGGAAALGSMMADLLGGWAVYAPATFVIKFLVAALAAYILRTVKGHKGMLVGAAAAELLMVGGYFLYESLVLALGAGAVASIPFNLTQGVVNVAAGVAAAVLLDRGGVLNRLK